ncbi:DUF554 domain-containing protein [Effusibacillus dendaii]|uniref:Membrane protein n=1 Tax=Effusibacillus dendaii TaxID=2743772 RepID=A0A7I8DBN0_9BACL|nr:DUF554 domain-containing protein [Effusibacillus dendaii]BCJ87484.1 membrane protein [Effusibacillus dendaii]
MALLGTLVNVAAIIVGSFLGMVFRRIPERMKQTILQGMGLAVFVIGAKMAFEAGNDLFWVIISLVVGALLGEWIDIEGKLEQIGKFAERKMTRLGGGKVAESFVFASLLYCVGAMAVVGALESGLNQNHSILYTKSVLDGLSSIIFTSTMGVGVLLAAIPVFVYQGIIAISAEWVKTVLSDPVVTMMSATGGVLIMGIAIQILDIKKINVGNLLPAIFVAGAIKWFMYR